jgi:Na+/proline symporter
MMVRENSSWADDFRIFVICFAAFALYDYTKGVRALYELDALSGAVIGVVFIVLFVLVMLVLGSFNAWRTLRDIEKENLAEAKRHGYSSWAEFMAAEGDPMVRESWQAQAQKEKWKRNTRFKI